MTMSAKGEELRKEWAIQNYQQQAVSTITCKGGCEDQESQYFLEVL